ncbi:A disintegrin and metalloproteinase with thrombospondin motifs like [Crassostrea virginica]
MGFLYMIKTYFLTLVISTCTSYSQWQYENTRYPTNQWNPSNRYQPGNSRNSYTPGSQGNARVPGIQGNVPADIHVLGDPNVDQVLGVKVATPDNIYNVELQRVNHNLLHEDVRYLSVSVDETGKTIFKEEYKPVDLHKIAKSMNFYHDINSGTFLNIRSHRLGGSAPNHTYIEGVMFDELMVAPPNAGRRHKRDLFPVKHTVWTKDKEESPFNYDTLKVPDFVDKLKLDVKKKTAQKQSHRRKKRQYRSPRIEPELLLFVDHALFRAFEGDSNELLEYLLHFWHSVNWKYLTITLAGQWPVIDLKIREIGVFKEPNAQPFIENSRIYKGSKLFSLYDAMDSLQKWLIRYENVLPVHDITFLQTGENACRKVKHRDTITPFSPNVLTAMRQGMPISSMDTTKDSNECVKGTAGVAYVRGACLSAPLLRGSAFNFGIGEASTSFNGVIIAAHEVGHLLGAYHDGESEASGCSSSSGFIMSYTRDDSFKFSRFSECSIRSFQNFLRMDRSSCLMQRSSKESLQFPTTFPGKYMTLHEQCRRFTGGPPCEEGPKQCEHLCCDDRQGEWRYTRSEPAVDGTSCGKANVCLNGQCVALESIG